MKNKIFLVLLILLLTTGCSCEYNLTINNNYYQENIIITADNQNEILDLNNEWKIPVDKEDYNLVGDSSTSINSNSKLYDYTVNNDTIAFKNNFNEQDYSNSSAISECYDRLSIIEQNDATILSTSLKAKCFDSQPELNSIKVNINVDRNVISSNADSHNENTYTWYIDKKNYNNKSINITLSNKIEYSSSSQIINNSSSKSSIIKKNTKNNDYTLYIGLGILLIVMILGYLLFNKMKEKNNQMDD